MTPSFWLFGLLFGMRHALEPDHLAAVSTLVTENRRVRTGAMLGTFWGLGHTLALLVVATLLAMVDGVMPPRLATGFELLVAAMLVALGTRSLLVARRGQVGSTKTGAAGTRFFARRSLLVGSIHGLAGSGAVTALVASRLPSTSGRLAYVMLFGLGSVVGMTALSGAAGWPLARIGRNPGITRALTAATGLLAFGLGVVWALPLVRTLLS